MHDSPSLLWQKHKFVTSYNLSSLLLNKVCLTNESLVSLFGEIYFLSARVLLCSLIEARAVIPNFLHNPSSTVHKQEGTSEAPEGLLGGSMLAFVHRGSHLACGV